MECSSQPLVDLSQEEKLYGLSLLWKEASYNFAFFDQIPELDFDQSYRDYITLVLNTKSIYEYYRVLTKFCALLQDGHTDITYPEGILDQHIDWPAIDLYDCNGQAVVVAVDSVYEGVIPLGSTVLSIDGCTLDDYLASSVLPYIASSTPHIRQHLAIIEALYGKPNSYVTIEVRTPFGKINTCVLARDAKQRSITKSILPFYDNQRPLFEYKALEHDIAYIALNGFDDPVILDDFKQNYFKIQQSQALVIDLRRNGGGNSAIGAEILSYFTDTDLDGATWKSRKHIAAYKAWGSVANQFAELEAYAAYARGEAWEDGDMTKVKAQLSHSHIVPTVVLIGRNTQSAAEDFLVFIDTLEHFTTVGETTYGSTGQPLLFELPGGGVARICTKRDTYPDGRDFVGVGIKPDIEVRLRYNDLVSGNDIVLEKAIQRLSSLLQAS